MSKKDARSKTPRVYEVEPCGAVHNPGRWPWVAACIFQRKHPGILHLDKYGQEWK